MNDQTVVPIADQQDLGYVAVGAAAAHQIPRNANSPGGNVTIRGSEGGTLVLVPLPEFQAVHAPIARRLGTKVARNYSRRTRLARHGKVQNVNVAYSRSTDARPRERREGSSRNHTRGSTGDDGPSGETEPPPAIGCGAYCESCGDELVEPDKLCGFCSHLRRCAICGADITRYVGKAVTCQDETCQREYRRRKEAKRKARQRARRRDYRTADLASAALIAAILDGVNPQIRDCVYHNAEPASHRHKLFRRWRGELGEVIRPEQVAA